ncbi:MAG: hypothetical protein ACK42H_20515 [Planctomycetota bacterium]
MDTNASPKERVAKMKSLVENVVNDLDASASADDKKNVATFLMRVAFHEGARLKERRQIASGPGRSVLVQREMDFCLIGVNRKWVTVTNLF